MKWRVFKWVYYRAAPWVATSPYGESRVFTTHEKAIQYATRKARSAR